MPGEAFWQQGGTPGGATDGDVLVLDGVVPLEPVGNDDDPDDWLHADTEDT